MWNFKKTHILLLLCATVFSLESRAQVGQYRNDLAIGFTGGVNMTSVSFVPKPKMASLMGENYGLVIRYTPEKYITAVCSVQIECNYANQGWKEVDDEDPDTYWKNMKYVQVPFLTRLAWGKERKGGQGFITLGPQLGFLLSEKQESTGDWEESYHTHKYQYSHDAKNKFDYGIAAGAGFQYSHPKLGHFQLEARYYFGLANFYDNSSKGYYARSGHSAISIKLGYLFDVFKTKDSNIK